MEQESVLTDWVGYGVFITYMSGPVLDQDEPTKSVKGPPETITASFLLEKVGDWGIEARRSADTPTIFMSWGSVLYIQGPPPDVRKQIDAETAKQNKGNGA